MNRRRNLQFILGLLVSAALIVSIGIFYHPKAQSDLQVYFLDVGQGDASYIKNASGQDILIDGGPDNSVLNQLDKVMNFGDREINLVILSHPHADHLTGLLEVLQRYQVDEVWETGVEYPSTTYAKWHQDIAQKNIPRKLVQAGESKSFGNLKFEILSPLSPLENKKIDNLNNASIVNRLDFERFSVLFTGDAEKDVQKQLLSPPAGGKNIHTDILKVAHHGSENGLLEDFLRVVRPAIAIISVGQNNKYGHPHQATLSLLKDLAVRIYRTDQNGTIEISSDGVGYNVSAK